VVLQNKIDVGVGLKKVGKGSKLRIIIIIIIIRINKQYKVK